MVSDFDDTRPDPDDEVLVVFGGRSEIGLAIADLLAPDRTVVLVARPGDMTAATDRFRGAGVGRLITMEFDADDTARHRQLVEEIERRAGAIDIAVLAFGILGDQERDEVDNEAVVRVLQTDFVAQASLLTVLAERMKPRRRGVLVAFSSVAGVRVRRANYVYGSAKAGLDGFASGLSDALAGTGWTRRANTGLAEKKVLVGSIVAVLAFGMVGLIAFLLLR